MADKRITDLPLIFSGDVTSTDVLPIVDVNLDITNKIEVEQLKSYILTGVNDYYVTGGTYSGGTLTLNRQNGSVTITGFTTGGTGTSLYEVGSGNDSVQLIGVSASASGDNSVVSGGLGNTALDSFSTISGGYCNTTNSGPGRNFIGNGGFNTISSYYGSNVIGGGENNRTYDSYRSVENNFIGGGRANTSSGYFSTVVGGIENCSFGNCSFVGGGRDNIAYCRSTIAGGRRNSAGTSGSAYSVNISGTYDGTGVAQGTYSVYTNTIPPSFGFGLRLLITFDSFGVITNTKIEQGGNLYNTSDQVIVPGNLFVGGSSTLNDVTYDITGTFTNSYASIIGGCGNTASGEYSTIGGGDDSTASGYASTISGGYANKANGNLSFIGGGQYNCSIGNYSTLNGGYNNTAGGECSFIGGGCNNISGVNNFVNSIFGWTYTGGNFNGTFTGVVPTSTGSGSGSGASFIFTFVSGTLTNVTIQFAGSNYTNGDTLFFNGSSFFGTPGVDDVYITIGTASDTFNTITGGQNNKSFGYYSTLSGGYNNTSSGCYSFIGGGWSNTTVGGCSTISGGYGNTASGCYSTVGGGSGNFAEYYGDSLLGGNYNQSSSIPKPIPLLSPVDGHRTVGGGYGNLALGVFSVIGGGLRNTTSGDTSMILGGFCNTTIGTRSAVVGGQSIVATENDMVYMPSANIQSSGYLYFGDVNTDGSWRMRISGATFIIEKRVGGVWITSGTFV